MYKIKVYYTTGDSFGSSDTSDVIEITWKNLEVAKENLKRIQNQYICYKVDNDYSGKKGWYFKSLTPEQKLMYDTKEQQNWYHNVNSKRNNDYFYAIILTTDEGNNFQFSPSWVGYFETLNWAEIITDPVEGGLRIEF